MSRVPLALAAAPVEQLFRQRPEALVRFVKLGEATLAEAGRGQLGREGLELRAYEEGLA